MSAWPEGYGRRIMAEVDSTLSEAARMAPGLRGPTWILAHRQSAGRGRRGRAWHDPAGNLAATLVMAMDEPPARAALRSFVAALALIEACDAVTGQPRVFTLKWPNDVLAGGGKLAGILLESSGGYLAIGIGANLAAAPRPDQVEPGALAPVSLSGQTGVTVDPESFLTYLASAYARSEARLAADGFAPIRAAWLARAARLGEVITARGPRFETRGVFETVDEAGNLVLKTDTGRTRISAAEIHF